MAPTSPQSEQADTTATAGPQRFCRQCAYPLIGLPENRCPECGQVFNLDDPKTYATDPRPQPKVTSIICAYLVTLFAALVLTQLFDWGQDMKQRYWIALSVIGGLAAPLALFIVFVGDSAMPGIVAQALAFCLLLWLLGLWVVLKTRMRKLPIPTHIVLAALWCSIGALWGFFVVALIEHTAGC